VDLYFGAGRLRFRAESAGGAAKPGRGATPTSTRSGTSTVGPRGGSLVCGWRCHAKRP